MMREGRDAFREVGHMDTFLLNKLGYFYITFVRLAVPDISNVSEDRAKYARM